MAYIPPDAKWYLAEIVVEHIIQDEPDNVVHTNLVLVRADSPEEAYEKAISLGDDNNIHYSNPEGKTVQAVFRGLRDLNVIHDELAHGTELIYRRDVGMSQQELTKWVTPKSSLGVLRAGMDEDGATSESLSSRPTFDLRGAGRLTNTGQNVSVESMELDMPAQLKSLQRNNAR